MEVILGNIRKDVDNVKCFIVLCTETVQLHPYFGIRGELRRRRGGEPLGEMWVESGRGVVKMRLEGEYQKGDENGRIGDGSEVERQREGLPEIGKFCVHTIRL